MYLIKEHSAIINTIHKQNTITFVMMLNVLYILFMAYIFSFTNLRNCLTFSLALKEASCH
jgi:hypothetical protein